MESVRMCRARGSMNIAYIVPEAFGGDRWGGVSTYVLNIARAMRYRGHKAFIVTHGARASKRLFAGVPVYTISSRITNPILRIVLFPFRYLMPDVYSPLEWALAVRQFVISRPVDIVEAPEWGASALFLCFLRAPKIVVRLHRSWYQYLRDNRLPIGLSHLVINILELTSAALAAAVTSPTGFMVARHKMLSWLLAIRRIPVFVISNAVPPWKTRNGRRKFVFPYILTVGRVEVGKGSILLADAFLRLVKQFPHLRLVYVGEDTTMFVRGRWQSCQAYIFNKFRKAKRTQNVIFTGKKAPSDLASYYRDCLFYVAPSRGHENPSLALLEALTMGKSVVASRTGGIPEVIVHEKNGLLFEEDNVHALRSALVRLTADHHLRTRLVRQSRRSVPAFNALCRQTEQLYRRIISVRYT